MTTIAYRAQALGPLRVVDWAIPPGVSVIVGPNRVGKSTLLRVPELIKATFSEDINDAFRTVFQDVPRLRNLAMPPSTPTKLGVSTDGNVEWEVELAIGAGRLLDFPSERLRANGEEVLWRKFGNDHIEGNGFRHPLRQLLPSLVPDMLRGIIARAFDRDPRQIPAFVDPATLEELKKRSRSSPVEAPMPVIDAFVSMVPMYDHATRASSFRSYDFSINHILRYGSIHSSDLKLLPTGENVFPLLRNWRDKLELEERYDFVLSTMREAFSHLGGVEFEQAGQTVTMNISDRRWPNGAKIPIAQESTGFITALLQLCALASCEPHGMVTLDEIETSLHPQATRVLVEACRRWAAKHDLRVVLATQSETVLDQFRDDPAKIFVLEPQQETSPKSLTELFSEEYLSQFSLGDLFAHLEFGSDPTTNDPA